MIEQLIYFALGCIVTALGALMFAPLFWSRALRLTRRRLQEQSPLSMEEIQAERDGLRVQFAVARLRLEQDNERVRAGKGADMAEIGRRSMDVARFSDQAAKLTEERDALRLDVAGLRASLTGLQLDLDARIAGADRSAKDVARLEVELSARRAEGVVLHTDIAGVRSSLAEVQRDRDVRLTEVERLSLELIQARGQLAAAKAVPIPTLAEVDRLLEAGATQARLQAVSDELAAARDREKSFHLEMSLKAEKGRSVDRDASDRLERLQSENVALQQALAAMSGERPAPQPGDAGLRESIHALGLAVAAMTRSEPTDAFATERNAAAVS